MWAPGFAQALCVRSVSVHFVTPNLGLKAGPQNCRYLETMEMKMLITDFGGRAFDRLALSCLALLFLVWLGWAWLALPRLALACPGLAWLALHCLALAWFGLISFALACLRLIWLALACLGLPWFALTCRHFASQFNSCIWASFEGEAMPFPS